VFRRKRWPGLIAVAVLLAVGTAAAIEMAYEAYSEGATVALPGRPAGEDVLNIRGALNGPCFSNGPFDWCVVYISCGANPTTGACNSPGANCTQGTFNGSLHNYCQDWYLFPTCTPGTTSCLAGSTNGCTNVAGGCLCQGTYPAWSSGVRNTC
jgi:hypothetical protein